MMYNLQIRHFIGPVLCLLFTLFSCQKNYLVNLDETNQKNQEKTRAQIYKALITLGFPTNNVKVNGDTIFVEDIILYKSLLFPNDQNTIPRQATSTAYPKLFNTGTIIIYFPPINNFAWGFSDKEVRRMQEGFNKFLKSNLNNESGFTKIIFTRNSNFGYHVQVNLASFESNSNTCANAELATTYRRGSEIGISMGRNINMNVNYLRGFKGKPKLTDSQLTFLIAGHLQYLLPQVFLYHNFLLVCLPVDK
ncbi:MULTISPECIES: hypothetical protein [unclassified Sphingobacterium]|uniref:hypothetical protein n=1 Tax=unclassified Sphingobacterium TaxID=2609468 RepID=UPI0025E0F66C|nr:MULTISPECIES: hypothetical protein [unclassified Sphingobacterium]